MNGKVIGLLIVVGALAPCSAVAGTAKSYSSTVKLVATKDPASGGYFISGTLKSANKACVNKRVVEVWLRNAAAPVYDITAQAVAKASGKWALAKNYPMTPGQYYAKVEKLKVKGGTCKVAKSKVVTGAP